MIMFLLIRCFVSSQVHKRFDPIYVDARDRIQALGDFSFFDAYVSSSVGVLPTTGVSMVMFYLYSSIE